MTTDVELVERHLKRLRAGDKVGTEAQLVQHFADRWSEARARSAVEKALAKTDVPLERGRGGTLKYSGTDAGIYADVRAGLGKWKPAKGWRLVGQPHDCHAAHGMRGAGDWLYPDALLTAHPLRRASTMDLPELHSFEIEHAGGFSIASVYQAFEQGRGANYSWVFFISDEADVGEWLRLKESRKSQPSTDDSAEDKRRKRILRAARERGVGLVAMPKATAPSRWLEIAAAERRPTENVVLDQKLLLQATHLPWPPTEDTP